LISHSHDDEPIDPAELNEARAMLMNLDAATTIFSSENSDMDDGYDGFAAACRKADAKARAQPVSAEIRRARRLLLDDSVSLERAWSEINDPRNRPTPKVIIEAIMSCVCERGLVALKEPANIERLTRCNSAAKAQLNERIARLQAKEVPHAPS
jgi:hypothetical protein